MAEIFTWECTWDNACDICPAKLFFEKNPGTTDIEKKEMIEVASVANMLRKDETGLREELLAKQAGRGVLSAEAIAVSIESVAQWQDNGCSVTIRRATGELVG